MLIKIVLIAALSIFFLYFFGSSSKLRARAWQKIIILLLPLVGIASVLFPGLLDTIAQALGIGRGADLLLYFMIVIFLFFSARVYLKFREVSLKQDKIISRMALLEKELDKD